MNILDNKDLDIYVNSVVIDHVTQWTNYTADILELKQTIPHLTELQCINLVNVNYPQFILN